MNYLKRLEYLKDKLKKANITYKTEPLEDIENALKRLEELEIMYSNCVIESAEQKKALEIIKDKVVSVYKIKICDSVEEYNKLRNTGKELVEQEFELMKKVLL